MAAPGIEPPTLQFQVNYLNHYATRMPRASIITSLETPPLGPFERTLTVVAGPPFFPVAAAAWTLGQHACFIPSLSIRTSKNVTVFWWENEPAPWKHCGKFKPMTFSFMLTSMPLIQRQEYISMKRQQNQFCALATGQMFPSNQTFLLGELMFYITPTFSHFSGHYSPWGETPKTACLW